MGAYSDLDIFISQHCKDNAIMAERIRIELSNHFDGKPLKTLSKDSLDVLDVWTVYCNEIDSRIAR